MQRRYSIDISAIVINKLLEERSIEIWSRLKLVFLDSAFSSLYSAIAKYYDAYGNVPSFDDLEIGLREGVALRSLATVKLASNPEISAEVALAALIDQYTQSETIKLLDKFIDNLPVLDTTEIKEELSSIVLTLDEKTLTTENVYSMADLLVFQDDSALARDRVFLGFNNTFDSVLAGIARQELVLVGGRRGAGKSICCSNIQVNQYEMGNVCPYFTIEMIASEVMQRNTAILANVDHGRLKTNTLEPDEILRVVQARASMFVDADDLVREFVQKQDRFKFEQRLIKDKKLRDDAQMIIVDDRALSITGLDLHLGKIKARFGDKFKVGVVDYLNKIRIEGSDTLEWKTQIEIATRLKDLARKHDIVIFSPYQIDESGEARFAKGILDSADIALVMTAHDKADAAISMETTKIRGSGDIKCTSPINWSSLRISPQSIDPPQAGGDKAGKKIKRTTKEEKKEAAVVPDSNADIPWDV